MNNTFWVGVYPGTELGIGKLEYRGISLEYNEFDPSSIYTDFDFKPQYNFKQGIKKIMDWIISDKQFSQYVKINKAGSSTPFVQNAHNI